VAYHPWAIGGAPVNVTKLLLHQRTDTVSMAVVAMLRRQILAAHDLGFMRAPLIALMGDTVAC